MTTATVMTSSVDARITAEAASTRLVCSDHRLRLVGISRWAITSRVRAGTLHEVLPRTYAFVGAEQLDHGQRCVAARESLQHHRSLLAFETAGRALRIWSRGRGDVIHVLAQTQWRPADVPWVDYHWTKELGWDERIEVEGLEVTGLLRTCLDLGCVLTEWQLTHVLWEAEFRHGLDLDELERVNGTRRGRRGCAVVRAAIGHRRAGSAGTRSTSEDHLLAGIVRAGVAAPLVCNPEATELRHIECDMVWPRERLVVEVDGTTGHRRSGQRARDAGCTEALERAGYRVLRVPTAELWADRDAVVARIERALHGQRTEMH